MTSPSNTDIKGVYPNIKIPVQLSIDWEAFRAEYRRKTGKKLEMRTHIIQLLTEAIYGRNNLSEAKEK